MESGEGSAPSGGQEPAPGWYPDPTDSDGLRYWDGKRWTVEQAGREDGPPAPKGEAAPAPPPKPLGPLARSVILLIVICALANVAYLFVALHYSDRIDSALAGDVPTESEAQDVDDAYAAVNGIALLTLVIAGVTFLVWFHRAYSNVASLVGRPLRFGTGWSVGAWFVPILAAWRPKQIANDIWRAGDRKARGTQAWNSLPVPGFVHWWWALWLLAGLASSVGGLMASQDPVLVDFAKGAVSATRHDLETERDAATVLAGSAALEVIAAIAAAMFVRQASRRQDELISGEPG
jgi:hypothetical protein